MAESRVLSIPEVVKGLRQAGFPEHVIPTMAAIAGGESSYRTRAYNPRGADDSFGVLQINMEGPLGPARREQFGLSSNEDLYDPATNFRAAKAIYDSQGLEAWGAYTDGGYKRYVPQVTAAMSQMPKMTASVGDKVESSAASAPQKLEPQQAPKQTPRGQSTRQVAQNPRSALKDIMKENLFRNLMGQVTQSLMGSAEGDTGPTEADLYYEAANELSASEDPYDQELARKYELKAMDASVARY